MTSGRPASATLEQTLLVSRVVVGALLFGVLTFAGVVVVVLPDPDPSDRLMIRVAMVGLAIGVIGSFVAGRFLQAYHRGRALTDEDLLAQAFFQTTLVRAAALEGAAFLCLIAVMVSGDRLGFAGAGLCAVLLAALFPSRAAWDRFHAAVGGGGDGRFEPR